MAIEYLGLSEVNGPLVVLEGVKKYDRSSNCEFEDVFTLVIRKSRNCNL